VVTDLNQLVLDYAATRQVLQENDPRNALAASRNFNPDLILLDVMMPHMEGSDVARLLRADPLLKRVPIIFLTASLTARKTHGHEVRVAGWDYLAKPVNVTELTRDIEAHL
jgi:two-component system, OmpR family, phosphate regulon response regulator PhoB